MRILLDPAVYSMGNKGILAMLQTEVTRLNELWPHANIEVLTDAPHLIRLYCPTIHPVSASSRRDWSSKKKEYDRFHHTMPRSLLKLLLEVREIVRPQWPDLSPARLQQVSENSSELENVNQKDGESDSDDNDLQKNHDLLQALRATDLFVVAGGGYMCDSAKAHLLKVLSRMELAVKLGKPIVMVGQGVGPLEDVDLRDRLRAILPLVDLILVRENRIAMSILKSLDVPMDRVMMTGDDAIEMVYQSRRKQIGRGIGVNIRLAPHTQVGREYIEILRPILQRAAYKNHAKLIGLPIAWTIQDPDYSAIYQLLLNYKDILIDQRRFETPLELIKKTGLCRLVVTGAFHAAVFALAQGIPVIGLVKSNEYNNKFSGLQDEFGPACQIIRLDDGLINEKLPTAIDLAWSSAEGVRPMLLKAAQRQIDLGHAGYQRLFDIFREK